MLCCKLPHERDGAGQAACFKSIVESMDHVTSGEYRQWVGKQYGGDHAND